MKNIITSSSKLTTAGIAAIATLSVLTVFAPTPASSEDARASLTPKQLNQTYYGGHAYKGHKYRSHKKHYKRLKRVKRVRKQVPAYHYNGHENHDYYGKSFKHRRKHSGYNTQYR